MVFDNDNGARSHAHLECRDELLRRALGNYPLPILETCVTHVGVNGERQIVESELNWRRIGNLEVASI